MVFRVKVSEYGYTKIGKAMIGEFFNLKKLALNNYL